MLFAVVVAADIVLRRKLQLLDGHILTARWSSAKKGSFTDPRTVEVSGITKGVSQDLLLMYFENEAKSGGGNVEDIQMFDDNTAYITFESSEGAFLVVNIFVTYFPSRNLTVFVGLKVCHLICNKAV